MAMQNLFQFVPCEGGELALFIYAREGKIERPVLRLMSDAHKMELYRSGEDMVTLAIADEALFTQVKNKNKLLVCEVLPAENEGEVEILQTYLVDIAE